MPKRSVRLSLPRFSFSPMSDKNQKFLWTGKRFYSILLLLFYYYSIKLLFYESTAFSSWWSEVVSNSSLADWIRRTFYWPFSYFLIFFNFFGLLDNFVFWHTLCLISRNLSNLFKIVNNYSPRACNFPKQLIPRLWVRFTVGKWSQRIQRDELELPTIRKLEGSETSSINKKNSAIKCHGLHH